MSRGASCPGSPQEHDQQKPYDRHSVHRAEVRTRKTGCRESSRHGARRAVCARGPYTFPTVCLVSRCFLLFRRVQTGFFANPHLEKQGLLQFVHHRPKTTCTTLHQPRHRCHVPGSSARVPRLTEHSRTSGWLPATAVLAEGHDGVPRRARGASLPLQLLLALPSLEPLACTHIPRRWVLPSRGSFPL